MFGLFLRLTLYNHKILSHVFRDHNIFLVLPASGRWGESRGNICPSSGIAQCWVKTRTKKNKADADCSPPGSCLSLAALCIRCCCYLVVQLCPTLCDPWTVACQAPLSMGFSRQEYRCELPFPSPSYLPDPRIIPLALATSPALPAD